MKFASTRDPNTIVTFRDAVFKGLAPDGGLYHPVQKADLAQLFRSFSATISFTDLAAAVTEKLFPEEITADAAHSICEKAFPFSPELSGVSQNITLLELYHGPSCAFKDFGASFLATSMEYFLRNERKRAIILTATSGDTGSAVARAFHKKENIDVVILYPSGRVSPLQEKQLTTVGDNVAALEVKGSFDDCQRMVKEVFIDPGINELLPLTSANSINLGRLIPQSFYYMYAWTRVKQKAEKICFSVPSGNFGNLTAGVLAWEWGLPVDRFIAATNINDVVPEYLKTQHYVPRPSVQTYSNAMDVGDPSNFERLQAIFGKSWDKMRQMIQEEVVTDRETVDTILETYSSLNRFIDPHTAVGYLASKRFLEQEKLSDRHVVSLSTAHPGKFLEIVEQATGKRPELPVQLEEAMRLPKRSTVIDNTAESLSDFLIKQYS